MTNTNCMLRYLPQINKKHIDMKLFTTADVPRSKKLSTLYIHCQLILDKVAKKAQREKIISATNGIGKV